MNQREVPLGRYPFEAKPRSIKSRAASPNDQRRCAAYCLSASFHPGEKRTASLTVNFCFKLPQRLTLRGAIATVKLSDIVRHLLLTFCLIAARQVLQRRKNQSERDTVNLWNENDQKLPDVAAKTPTQTRQHRTFALVIILRPKGKPPAYFVVNCAGQG